MTPSGFGASLTCRASSTEGRPCSERSLRKFVGIVTLRTIRFHRFEAPYFVGSSIRPIWSPSFRSRSCVLRRFSPVKLLRLRVRDLAVQDCGVRSLPRRFWFGDLLRTSTGGPTRARKLFNCDSPAYLEARKLRPMHTFGLFILNRSIRAISRCTPRATIL